MKLEDVNRKEELLTEKELKAVSGGISLDEVLMYEVDLFHSEKQKAEEKIDALLSKMANGFTAEDGYSCGINKPNMRRTVDGDNTDAVTT